MKKLLILLVLISGCKATPTAGIIKGKYLLNPKEKSVWILDEDGNYIETTTINTPEKHCLFLNSDGYEFLIEVNKENYDTAQVGTNWYLSIEKK